VDGPLSWLLIALGVLAGVFLLIILAGSVLPRRHVVARALKTTRPVEEVWKVLTDIEALPTWHDGVVSVQRLPDHEGRPVWLEVYRGNYPIRLETTEAVPPRRLVRTVADASGPFRGRWEFDLSPRDGGCRVTLTEHGEVPNPFFRFMARLFMDPALYLEIYLRALAGKLGDRPVIERPPVAPT
jgi:uncharacterized protein YndB with AHSA1/START domain